MDAQLQFRIVFFNRCVVILLIMKFGITNQCPESKATINYVNSCPRSAEKWAEAAEGLNCQGISTNCTNFVYHCVMDHYKTSLIEVCAPKKTILGHLCVEYNGFGNVIQRNINAKCKTCPKMYKSTNVFQYPECLNIKTKMNITSDITAPLSQSNDSTNKTSSDESLHIDTTTDTISDLQHSFNNDNEIGNTNPTSVKTYHMTYPQSFPYQHWSSFTQVVFGTIIIVIVFVVTMVIIVSLFQWKTRNPCQIVCLNPRKSENSQHISY